MKRLFIIAAIVAGFAASACQSEKLPTTPQAKTKTFIASNNGLSRVYLDETNSVMRWNNGNTIKLYDGTTNQVVENTAADGEKGIFTASVVGDEITAVYPSSLADLSAFGTFSASVTNFQTAVADGVNADYYPMIAVAENTTNLVFRNAAALIKFRVGEDDIREVAFATNGGKGDIPISGSFTASVNGKNLDISGYAGTWINYTAPGGGTFTQGVDYYISVLPANLVNGFFFILRYDGGAPEVALNATRPLTINSSDLIDLGTVTSATVSSEFRFTTTNLNVEKSGMGQQGIDIVNPSAMEYSVKIDYYVNDVLLESTDEGAYSATTEVARLSNGVNAFIQNKTLLYVRNFPVNSTIHEQKYVFTAKASNAATSTITVIVAEGDGKTFTWWKDGDVEKGLVSAGNVKVETIPATGVPGYWFKTTSPEVTSTASIYYMNGLEKVYLSAGWTAKEKTGSFDDNIDQIPNNDTGAVRTWHFEVTTTDENVKVKTISMTIDQAYE